MTKEKFFKSYKDACAFMGIPPSKNESVAIAMAIKCNAENGSDFILTDEFKEVLEYCDSPRKEIEVVNHFKDRNPRRIRYLLLKLWKEAKLKKIDRGTYVKETSEMENLIETL